MADKIQSLVEQMPKADGRSMLHANVNKEQIETALTQLSQGGRESLLALIDMLDEPGSEQNVQPHYAAHCLQNYVLIAHDEKRRREISETLAAQLDSERPIHIKAYLCELLQWAGREEATPALGKLLLDEQLVEPASMALVAIREGAAKQFRAALPKSEGKCRLNVVQGLGAVEDASSVGALQAALKDPDREVRLAAGWGLSRVGDAASADALIQAAEVEAGWERVQATKHCLVLAERLAASNKPDVSRKIYDYLKKSRTDDSEHYIRKIAEQGIASVAQG